MRLRRLLGPLAAVWIACQLCFLVGGPIALVARVADEEPECTCTHGDHAMCPMHHRSSGLPQDRAHLVDEGARFEGLDDHRARTGGPVPLHLVLLGPSGEEDHGQAGTRGQVPDALEGREAVEPRHHDVEQHDLGCRRLDHLDRRRARSDRLDLEAARPFERDPHERADVGFVVDHEDARVRNVGAWWLNKRGVRDEVRDMAVASVKLVREQESTALGAGIHAAAAVGLHPDLRSAADAMTGIDARNGIQNSHRNPSAEVIGPDSTMPVPAPTASIAATA